MNNILFYTVVAFILVIALGLWFSDDAAMRKCQTKYSFETCYSELHR